jgi:hypothetical protein
VRTGTRRAYPRGSGSNVAKRCCLAARPRSSGAQGRPEASCRASSEPTTGASELISVTACSRSGSS